MRLLSGGVFGSFLLLFLNNDSSDHRCIWYLCGGQFHHPKAAETGIFEVDTFTADDQRKQRNVGLSSSHFLSFTYWLEIDALSFTSTLISANPGNYGDPKIEMGYLVSKRFEYGYTQM